MRPVTIPILAVLLTGGLTLLTGCSFSERHQLESSLRQSETSIRRLERELASARQKLHDQESELQVLKETSEDSGFHTASSSRSLEAGVAWGAVDRLRIHPLASGVLTTADDTQALSLAIQPLDSSNEVVKVAGELQIRVQRPGEPELLNDLVLSSLESRDAWSAGIVARGFQVELPLPSDLNDIAEPGSQLLVTATLDLGHERRFTATQLIRLPATDIN